MTEKRFKLEVEDDMYYTIFDAQSTDEEDKLYGLDDEQICELLNNFHDVNQLLKQDNNALIHLLENQSIIIQGLHSKLLEYQVKEPIVLTKEDLELMGKAISYYTHGRYGE